MKNTLYCHAHHGRGRCSNSRRARPSRDIGFPDPVYMERNPLRPLLGENWMEGQILFIDHFENIIVNITHDQFEEQRQGPKFQDHL